MCASLTETRLHKSDRNLDPGPPARPRSVTPLPERTKARTVQARTTTVMTIPTRIIDYYNRVKFDFRPRRATAKVAAGRASCPTRSERFSGLELGCARSEDRQLGAPSSDDEGGRAQICGCSGGYRWSGRGGVSCDARATTALIAATPRGGAPRSADERWAAGGGRRAAGGERSGWRAGGRMGRRTGERVDGRTGGL